VHSLSLPATDPPAPPRRRVGRSILALVAVAWVIAGLAGVYRYAHDYWLYRGFKPPAVAAGVAPGHAVEMTFDAAAFGGATTHYLAYLPAGYARQAAAGRRFGVLYVLHGHPGRAADILEAGSIGADLDQLVAEHRARPMIIVLPLGDNGPEGGGDTEWANMPQGRYDSVLVDLVHDVDSRFATRADRGGRVLAGLSSGAYAAINVGLHNLKLFGNLQCWSGYFIQTRSGVFKHATIKQLRENSPEDYVVHLKPRIRRLGLRAFIYVGNQDHQSRIDELLPFAAKLRAAGARVTTAEYPGAHDWALWRQQMPHMLRVASRWLRAPPHGKPARA
jgi:enterochelin esterase-like enzyme